MWPLVGLSGQARTREGLRCPRLSSPGLPQPCPDSSAHLKRDADSRQGRECQEGSCRPHVFSWVNSLASGGHESGSVSPDPSTSLPRACVLLNGSQTQHVPPSPEFLSSPQVWPSTKFPVSGAAPSHPSILPLRWDCSPREMGSIPALPDGIRPPRDWILLPKMRSIPLEGESYPEPCLSSHRTLSEHHLNPFPYLKL